MSAEMAGCRRGFEDGWDAAFLTAQRELQRLIEPATAGRLALIVASERLRIIAEDRTEWNR